MLSHNELFQYVHEVNGEDHTELQQYLVEPQTNAERQAEAVMGLRGDTVFRSGACSGWIFEAEELSLIKCREKTEGEMHVSEGDAKYEMEQKFAAECDEWEDEACDAGWEAFLIGWYRENGGGIVLSREDVRRAQLAWDQRCQQRDEEEAQYMSDVESEDATRDKDQLRKHLAEMANEEEEMGHQMLRRRNEMDLHDEYKARCYEQYEKQLQIWMREQKLREERLDHRSGSLC